MKPLCEHDFKACGYNSSIVIEECAKCGEEKETDFDAYCNEYGFPMIEEEENNGEDSMDEEEIVDIPFEHDIKLTNELSWKSEYFENNRYIVFWCPMLQKDIKVFWKVDAPCYGDDLYSNPFTDKNGDIYYYHINGKTLTYHEDNPRLLSPEEVHQVDFKR